MQRLSQHIDIFSEIFAECTLTQKAIAKEANLSESKISRLLKNGKDLSAGEFFQLIDSMPAQFKRQFWEKFQGKKVSLSNFVDSLTNEEVVQMLRLLADRAQMALLAESDKNDAIDKKERKGIAA